MEWNVFYRNINTRKIERFNVFDHGGFRRYVEEDLKRIKDKDEFAGLLRGHLFYYFGSKCEYEVIVSSFPNFITTEELDRLNKERNSYKEKYGRDIRCLNVDTETEVKIDIRDQVMNNFNIFLDYVWSHKEK